MRFLAALGGCVFLVVLVIGINVLDLSCESAGVVRSETGPKAINQKYEWFKDTASQIRAQNSNIEVLKKRNQNWMKDIGPRENWARTDRETWSQYNSELSGAVTMYNRLVGEYNAEMSKWHTEFTNFGKMPKGWEDITPDKFAEYRSE